MSGSTTCNQDATGEPMTIERLREVKLKLDALGPPPPPKK